MNTVDLQDNNFAALSQLRPIMVELLSTFRPRQLTEERQRWHVGKTTSTQSYDRGKSNTIADTLAINPTPELETRETEACESRRQICASESYGEIKTNFGPSETLSRAIYPRIRGLECEGSIYSPRYLQYRNSYL